MFTYLANFTQTAKKKNPELWSRIVSEVKSSDKGGMKGQWSARKAQLATQKYKQRGGTYTGKKATTKNNSLKKWTSEKWTTHDGKPAIRKDKKGTTQVNRYLPAKAWENLSPQQKAATNRAKRKGFSEGKQFVPNAKAAKKAGKEARNFSYMN